MLAWRKWDKEGAEVAEVRLGRGNEEARLSKDSDLSEICRRFVELVKFVNGFVIIFARVPPA